MDVDSELFAAVKSCIQQLTHEDRSRVTLKTLAASLAPRFGSLVRFRAQVKEAATEVMQALADEIPPDPETPAVPQQSRANGQHSSNAPTSPPAALAAGSGASPNASATTTSGSKRKGSSGPTTTAKKAKKAADAGASSGGAAGGSGGGFNALHRLSPALAAVVRRSVLSRPKAVKRIWRYIRQHNLQNPQNRRSIVCDKALKAAFKCDEMTAFSLNRADMLGANLLGPATPEDVEADAAATARRHAAGDVSDWDDEDDEDAAQKKKAKKEKAKLKKRKAASGGGSGNSGTGLNKPSRISKELAGFLTAAGATDPGLLAGSSASSSSSASATAAGAEGPTLSRPRAVKLLWEYIKSNQLQDKSSGSIINLDDALRRLFKTKAKTVTSFGLNRKEFLGRHFLGAADAGLEDDVDDDEEGEEDDSASSSDEFDD